VTRRRWLLAALLGIFAAAAVGWTLLAPRDTGRPASTARSAMGEPSRGGSLVATLRTEPKTFNRYTGNGFPTHLIATLTQARLVRINNATSELEPWLAERWTTSDDRRTYTLKLREGVRFSDGAPFTAADVLFSFAAVYDSKTASPLADSLRVKGKPLEVRAISPSVVALTLPEPYGPGLRMLDNLPIYPQHRLARALADGSFGTAWGPQTPPGEMAGLGPFVLTHYDPGQRLAFARNPHYWRRDAAGRTLPFLDRLTLEIVPDQNAELLRMQAGGLDVMQGEMRPEDYLPLKREADAGRLRVLDVGASLSQHLLWFNLGTPRPASGWLRAPEFRQALSAAVDRNAFARTVYLGAATPSWGVVSPANRTWFSEAMKRPAHDPDRARTLLAGIGLTDPGNSGGLKDSSGRPVQFTLLVQKGIAESEKGASFLREAFARVGVRMDVVALDPATMQGHWMRGDYDALYHHVAFTDTDPAGNMDFWLSSGSGHLWHPGQRTPATEWEARIDGLMTRHASAVDRAERQRMFADVQRTLSEQVPALSFATPRVLVSTSTRVTGGRAAVVRPQLLWDADEISLRAAP
jgi:peptide/nickel transport system substrate-binding protein